VLKLSDCLIIIGFKAAGKSTLSKALAKCLALPCYDLDDLLLKKYLVDQYTLLPFD
jgi:shikimate kinase